MGLGTKDSVPDRAISGFVNGMELRVEGAWPAGGTWDRRRLDHRRANQQV